LLVGHARLAQSLIDLLEQELEHFELDFDEMILWKRLN